MVNSFDFVLEYVYYISPDGVEYPLFGGQRALTNYEGVGQPDPVYIQERGTFQNGVTVQGFRYGPRVITLKALERADGRLERHKALAALLDVIRPTRDETTSGKLLFVLPDYVELEIPAWVQTPPRGDFDAASSVLPRDWKEEISFLCPDPFFATTMDRVVTAEVTDLAGLCLGEGICLDDGVCLGSNTVSQLTNVVYDGTWYGDKLIITIVGPLENPVIANNTNGQSIEIDWALAEDESIVIDIQPSGSTVVLNSDGVSSSILDAVQRVSDLANFRLETRGSMTADGTNEIEMRGINGLDGTTQISLAYRPQFLSIFLNEYVEREPFATGVGAGSASIVIDTTC